MLTARPTQSPLSLPLQVRCRWRHVRFPLSLRMVKEILARASH
ncbi:hypothetical protein ACVIYL_000212 [Bradyrhizobium sp. USDA 3315]